MQILFTLQCLNDYLVHLNQNGDRPGLVADECAPNFAQEGVGVHQH